MGYIPFPSTFAAFAARKCLDQVYMNACLPKLPVKIPGSYPGATATECGPSHNVAEDIAIMRTLPNILVADPGDDNELRSLMHAVVAVPGPVYFRVPKAEAPILFGPDHRFEWGRGNLLREGNAITLAGTGIATGILLKAADLLAAGGIQARVIHCASVKPLDEELVVGSARKTGRMLTLEMGRTDGGFGSAVAEVLARERPTRMRIMGLARDRIFRSAPFADILNDVGMNPRSVKEAAEALIASDS
jgi:transketolase